MQRINRSPLQCVDFLLQQNVQDDIFFNIYLVYLFCRLMTHLAFAKRTLWLRPCLSNKEMIDLIWPSSIKFKASGLSIKMQCNTSKIPMRMPHRSFEHLRTEAIGHHSKLEERTTLRQKEGNTSAFLVYFIL